jgi:hypothetical protein
MYPIAWCGVSLFPKEQLFRPPEYSLGGVCRWRKNGNDVILYSETCQSASRQLPCGCLTLSAVAVFRHAGRKYLQIVFALLDLFPNDMLQTINSLTASLEDSLNYF